MQEWGVFFCTSFEEFSSTEKFFFRNFLSHFIFIQNFATSINVKSLINVGSSNALSYSVFEGEIFKRLQIRR